jgi:hypothetical protein
MDIKIQSISDIITNSSSEVYLRTWYGCEDYLKEIIDALAGKGFSDNFDIVDCDDHIKITAKTDDYADTATVLKKINDLFYASDSSY